MPIRAILFDLGGVIVRTENRLPREQLAERVGLTYAELSHLVFDSETAVQATLGKMTTARHWEAIRQRLNLSAAEFPRVPEDFWGGDTVDYQLVDFIRSLRPRYQTALLSNAWDGLRDWLENDWHIADAFDAIVISAEVGIAKPDPQIFHLALERLAALPEEAVFVDDFPQNVEAARALGLHAIRFVGPEQAIEDLQELLENP